LKQFPTPIHKWNLPNLPNGTEVWIKVRDKQQFAVSMNRYDSAPQKKKEEKNMIQGICSIYSINE
jgi:hypothetical protein